MAYGRRQPRRPPGMYRLVHVRGRSVFRSASEVHSLRHSRRVDDTTTHVSTQMAAGRQRPPRRPTCGSTGSQSSSPNGSSGQAPQTHHSRQCHAIDSDAHPPAPHAKPGRSQPRVSPSGSCTSDDPHSGPSDAPCLAAAGGWYTSDGVLVARHPDDIGAMDKEHAKFPSVRRRPREGADAYP